MAAFLVAQSALGAGAADKRCEVKVRFGQTLGPLEIDHFALGQGGQSDEPMWDQRTAEIRALRPRLVRLFVQEYFNLLPRAGQYHFESLDRSVETILRARATPLVCLCFKPRVLFPRVDQGIVEPADYGAWEQLIENLVRHYARRGGRGWYWEVGNEVDIGEDGGCPYLFQPESYNRYYEHTVRAILRADPQARVGGPALASWRSPILPAFLADCQTRKIPLSFVSWHIYSDSPRAIRATIDGVKSLLAKHRGLKVQTVLDEWSLGLDNPPRDPRFHPCYVAETVWQMKAAGLDHSCYYQIRDYHVAIEQFTPFMSAGGAASMAAWWNRKAQHDGLFDFQDTVRPAYFAFKLLARLTGDRLGLESARRSVHGFATHDRRMRLYQLLLWNFSPRPVEVHLTWDKLPGNLRALALVLDAMTPEQDENARLRAEPPVELTTDSKELRAALDAYGVRFWTLEPCR